MLINYTFTYWYYKIIYTPKYYNNTIFNQALIYLVISLLYYIVLYYNTGNLNISLIFGSLDVSDKFNDVFV